MTLRIRGTAAGMNRPLPAEPGDALLVVERGERKVNR
jgi:hypothetical protein